MERLLWHLLVGTRGGLTRGRILELLADRPYNANELAKSLAMDYKTIRHHLRVLEKNRLVEPSMRAGYGVLYFLMPWFERDLDTFRRIWEKLGKSGKMADTSETGGNDG